MLSELLDLFAAELIRMTVHDYELKCHVLSFSIKVTMGVQVFKKNNNINGNNKKTAILYTVEHSDVMSLHSRALL